MSRQLVWTHELDGTQNGVIGRDFIELATDTVLDQSEELSLIIPADHPKAYLLAEEITLRHRGRQFYVDELTSGRKGTKTTIEVAAKALWYRLGDIDYVGALNLEEVDPITGLEAILAGDSNGWTAEPAYTVATGEFSMSQQDQSLLRLIRTWAKITGTFAQFDTLNKTVALSATRGGTIPASFRTGRNLVGLDRRRRGPKAMQLIPYGANNLTIAGVNGGSPIVEDVSWYTDRGLTADQARSDYLKRRVWVDGSFVRDVDLLPAAETKLERDSQTTEEVRLDVLDISSLTSVTETVTCGDAAIAQDAAFGDEWTATVTRTQIDHLRPERTRIELSTSPNTVDDPSESSERTDLAEEWVQFTGRIRANYQVRNDGDYILARIPLRFREGGRANFHVDVWATGVGAGNMIVTIIDTDADPEEQQFKMITVPYTNGATVRAYAQWAAEELSGAKNYKVRITTEATGGASGIKGVNVDADAETPLEASFWIMAQGAVQETPVEENSVTYLYTGSVQEFTVPDNVETITIEAYGGAGGGGGHSSSGGGGGFVAGTFGVVPGAVYDVYVGGVGVGPQADNASTGGWPNGGDGGDAGASSGAGGGGSSDVRPDSGALTSALIVAAGGGGAAEASAANLSPNGGSGGYLIGGGGQDTAGDAVATGASQSAGGVGASTGSFGQGGDGASNSGNPALFAGGGGGGGWYGGGGGVATYSPQPGYKSCGGGGGSGYLVSSADDAEFADGANSGDGFITISWETPPF